ncbi:DUF945 family protein [Desulfobacula sp.]
MKKISLAVLVIILLAGAGTPLFKGLMMERILKQAFEKINQRNADKGFDISLEILEYDRNYFSSQIEWKINTGILKTLYGVEDIVLIDRADHGISTMVSDTSLEKNKGFMDFVNNKLNGKNPLEIKTKYRLSGNIESRITMEPFSFKDGNTLIEIKPGQMVLCFDKGVKNISSEMTWAGYQAPGKSSMVNLSFHSKMDRKSSYVWEGNILFAIEKMKADDGKVPFELANLKADHTMTFDKEGNRISIGMGYGMDRITAGQGQIKDGFFQINVNKIDARGYEDFITLYSQIVHDSMDEIVAAKSHPHTMAKTLKRQMTTLGIQLLGVYEKILKKGFEIQVSGLKAQLPQGKLKGDVTISLKKDMTMAQFLPIMMKPSKALDIFYLKSDISLPYSLFGDNEILLSPLYSGMQTGLFVKKGDRVVHRAKTREQKLFLNGKEVVLN